MGRHHVQAIPSQDFLEIEVRLSGPNCMNANRVDQLLLTA